MRTAFIILFSWLYIAAYGQDTLMVRDLSHGWMGLTKEGEALPVFDVQDHRVIVIDLPDEAEGQFLRLYAPDPVDIWWKGQLLYHDFDSTLLLRMDTLRSGSIKIFAEHGVPSDFSAQVVKITSSEFSRDPILEKSSSVRVEVHLVIGLMILLLAAFFRRNFTITFYQSFQNPLSYKIRSISVDQTYVNFGSVDNLYSLFFFSCVLSFLTSYLDIGPDLIKGISFWNGIFNWLVVSLGFMAMILLKFLLAKMIGSLYQIRELPNIQVQDFIHFFTLVVSIAITLSFFDFSLFDSESASIKHLIVYLLVGSILFFQVWLFFKFDKFYTVRKLMIISYLCTTEFLPGFLTIYWLTKM